MHTDERGLFGSLCYRFEEFISGVALVAMVICVFWGVITRYITETPAAWAAELAGLSFAWLVFMGAAAAFKYSRLHMSINMLVDLLPVGLRQVVALLVDLFILAFLVYVVWLAIVFSINALGDPMPILRWPRSVLYASVGVGSFCMAIRYFAVTVAHWSKREMPNPPFVL